MILAVSGAILVVTIIAGRNVARDISHTVIDRALYQAEKELDHFFDSIRNQVLVGQRWAASQLLDADDTAALNSLFVPILEAHPQISSMMVSDSMGTGYLLLHDALQPDEWMNRVVTVEETGNEAYFRYWNVRSGEVREETKPTEYDVRNRIWYQESLKTDPDSPGNAVHWTKPVIFYLTKDPGITAGSHVTLPDGRQIVVAFDLLLLDVSRLTTRRIRPSLNGTAFVFVEDTETGDFRVVGLPRDPALDTDAALRDALIVTPQSVADAEAELPRADDLTHGPVADTVSVWRQQSGNRSGSKFRFDRPDGPWWAELRSYDVGQNRFWIGVAVPESDFLANVNRQLWTVIGIELLALAAATGMALMLARNYGVPIEKLAENSRRIRSLDLDVDADLPSSLAEIRDLAQSQRELVSAMGSFVRYVPLEVVRELVRQGNVAQIGGREMPLTILFTDIEGFTSIAERMPPQQLAEHMAEYFNVMLAELGQRGATVDKFVGDAIVAFWGAPRPDEQHNRNALLSVLACQHSLSVMNQDWQSRQRPSMPTRFGLATGEVVVGNIGAESRLSYTVLGDAVNLAARLEALNKRYGTKILVSGDTREHASGEFLFRRIDRVAVVGKSETVDIYELLGVEGEVSQDRLGFARAYEKALDQFQAGEFAAATDAAERLKQRFPDDRSVELLMDACEQYLQNPPTSPWDGANRLTRKY